MRIPFRKLSWALGIAGLLGILLQSLQVQVEHTHSDGDTPHSHTHGHRHSHGHSHHHGHDHHHHSHDAHSKRITPQTHIHITLLWWEFTLHTSSPKPDSVAKQNSTTSAENSSADTSEPAHQRSLKTQGPLLGSLHWSQIISEWYSAWQSVLPPDKNRLPVQQGHANLNLFTTSCYQSLSEAPPVPPPEIVLSVSIS
ncbi:hypothetical protein Pan241w_10850 [Gimesia alba]|uniref:Uncharacterized protein n=1 Tax=Gimesia alba TaxID=2527973 RepID=A0A517RAW4_9PLAN|nr:hypothetical protein [Gimesia alba]QDT41026.1 hypothetical protein Pan241w_10850 [Gimesia alba]